MKINCKTLASRVVGPSATPCSPDASLRSVRYPNEPPSFVLPDACLSRLFVHEYVYVYVCERTRAYTRVHAVAGTSAAFARGGGQGGRSDGKVNTDVAARKRRLPANANVARGAWRPRESRRHGADIVPHLVKRRRDR